MFNRARAGTPYPHLGNREAVACDSLERKSQVFGDNGTMSRKAAAGAGPRSSNARPAVASRLHLLLLIDEMPNSWGREFDRESDTNDVT